MTATPITDAFGAKLTALIERSTAEAASLRDSSATDASLAGLVAEALGEVAFVVQHLEERINAVAQATNNVDPGGLTGDLGNVGF